MAFRFDRLTFKSQEAVQAAQGLRKGARASAARADAPAGGPARPRAGGRPRRCSSQLGVNPAQILRAAEEGLDALPKVTGGETTLGPDLGRVFDAAQAEADRLKDQYVSVEHLLLGLAKVKGKAQDLLGALGVDREGRPPGPAEGPRRPAR